MFIYRAILESETTDQQESIEQIVTTDSCFQNKLSKDNFLNSPNWEFQCLRYSILYIFRREPIIHKELLKTKSTQQVYLGNVSKDRLTIATIVYASFFPQLAAQRVSFCLNFRICKLNKNVSIWKKIYNGIFLKK